MKKTWKVKQCKQDKVFDFVNIFILIFLVILIVLPIMNLIALAFSNGIHNPNITFFPIGGTLDLIKYVIKDPLFLKSLGNSVIITLTVTIVSNLLMALAAYPLSKPDCPFRKGLLFFFVITMLFSPGIIPIYLLLSEMNLTDSIWSIILTSFMNVFNLLLYKTYFESIPKEVEEAATIDGASNFKLFIHIIFPMSIPIVASCSFFTIVGTWNNYGSALLFINDPDAYPLSLYIYKLIQQTTESYAEPWKLINAANIQAATIVVSIIPILIIYPLVIKYIKSGISVGSVKG